MSHLSQLEASCKTSCDFPPSALTATLFVCVLIGLVHFLLSDWPIFLWLISADGRLEPGSEIS